MVIEQLQVVIPLIVSLISALTAAVTFVIKFTKAVKERNAEEAKAILEDAAREAVEFVEQLQSTSGDHLAGETKKSIALVRINEALIQKGIKFDVVAAGNVIEKLIQLTKNVNVKSKE